MVPSTKSLCGRVMFWGGASVRQHLLILNKSPQLNYTTLLQDINSQWEMTPMYIQTL